MLPLAPRLRQTARRLVRDASTADDVVQEALLRAYRTFAGFVPGTNFRAWLLTILYSVAADTHRRGRRERGTVSIEELEERFERRIQLADPAAHVVVLDSVTRGDDVARVNRALAALPEPFRSAVVLVEIEELTYEEAASALGCPIGTVRSRLFRGRRALAVLLQADGAALSGGKRGAERG